MNWPPGHPLKDAYACPWCGAGPSPDRTSFECKHEILIEAVARTLSPEGYADAAAAMRWLEKAGADSDPVDLYLVCLTFNQWNSEFVMRHHAQCVRVAMAFLILITILVVIQFTAYMSDKL